MEGKMHYDSTKHKIPCKWNVEVAFMLIYELLLTKCSNKVPYIKQANASFNSSEVLSVPCVSECKGDNYTQKQSNFEDSKTS